MTYCLSLILFLLCLLTLDSQAQNVVESEFENDANFPDPINMNQNQDGNFIDDSGNVVLYNYANYFAEIIVDRKSVV